MCNFKLLEFLSSPQVDGKRLNFEYVLGRKLIPLKQN